MSVKIMSAIWPCPMPPSSKIVLLKLADCASDDGRNAYPAVATIARETGLSERSVQYTLRKLEADGLVAVDQPAGRYQPTSYRVDIEAIRRLVSNADDGVAKGAGVAPLDGPWVQPATFMGATDDAMGATDDVHGCKSFAPDPSLTVIDPSLIREGSAGAPALAPADIEDDEKPRTKPKHKPITDDWLDDLQASEKFKSLRVRDIYERVTNIKRWDGYKDKRRGFLAELGYELERQERWGGSQPRSLSGGNGRTSSGGHGHGGETSYDRLKSAGVIRSDPSSDPDLARILERARREDEQTEREYASSHSKAAVAGRGSAA